MALLKQHGVRAPPHVAPSAPPAPSALARASLDHARATKRALRQVARLSELSQQQGQFNNPGPRINELCGALKRELGALDAGARALSAAAGRVGGGAGGPTLEVCVSRTRYMASVVAHPLRVVGLAACLANARDVGEWLEKK